MEQNTKDLRQSVLVAYQLAHGVRVLPPGEDADDAIEVPAASLIGKSVLKASGFQPDTKLKILRVEKDPTSLRALYFKSAVAMKMVNQLLALSRLSRRSVGLGG